MNKTKLDNIRAAAKAGVPGSKVILLPDLKHTVKLELPSTGLDGSSLYFFIGEAVEANEKLALLIPVESVGIHAVEGTLAMLQPWLKGYGLLLTQTAVIMEVNFKDSLANRIASMYRALLGLEGVKRIWKVEYDRRADVKGKGSKSASNATDNRPSR